MTERPLAAALLTVVVLWPICAEAQTDNKLALGGSVTTRVAGSSDADSSAVVGIDIRLGHEREQWGWAYSFFNWFDVALDGRPTVSTDHIGRLRVRPIMVGYGYTWIRGRAAITANVLGGYSFNSFQLDGAALAEYASRGANTISADVSNTFVVRPGIHVWYDVSPRIGIKLTTGYLISRPTITVTSALGREIRQSRADTVLLTVGLVYSIF